MQSALRTGELTKNQYVMRSKYIFLLFLPLFMIALLPSCDESTGSVGIGMIEDDDIVTPGRKTFPIELENMLVDKDSVSNKSLLAYVGKFTDETFGELETSYMTQLFCLDDFRFDFDRIVKDTVWENGPGSAIKSFDFKDVSCYIDLRYDDFFGDSINPCQLEVYRLNKDLQADDMESYADPEEYYDKESGFLGRVAYTAANTSLDEDDRTATKDIIVALPEEYATEILNANYFHPEYFSDADAFIENVFKGMYVRQSMGNGTILYVNNSSLNINFTMYVDSAGVYPIKRKTPGYTDQDSTSIYSVSFNSTREVLQANQFANVFNERIINDTEHAYMKAPAGIYTSVKIPIGKLASELAEDTIMGVRLSVKAYRNEDGPYEMDLPNDILLVKKSEAYEFFRQNELPDNLSSYVATLNTGDNTYVFNNIASIITSSIADYRTGNDGVIDENAVEEYVLIPVDVTVTSDSSSSSTETTSVRTTMKPIYAKLPKSGNVIEVSYIRLGGF